VALSDSRWAERWRVVEALGRIGNPKTMRTLTKALRDQHVNFRVSAAIELGEIGDPNAFPALTDALSDREKTQVISPTAAASAP